MAGCRYLASIGVFLTLSTLPARGTDTPPDSARYVRPTANGFTTECKFLITRTPDGWTISSRTERGNLSMEVETHYDAKDTPLRAKAVVTANGTTQTVTAEVKAGKATVRRPGQAPIELEAPKGTIFTTAPDWTDVFLLCRRCDRQRQGKQEFPGLWLHPTQAPQRLTFTIEVEGKDAIELNGKKLDLDRCQIRIRNNSAYAAWTDAQGQLVRLLPLPAREGPSGLSLCGFEMSAARLRPPAPPSKDK